jgi:hypothetical protein
MKNLKKMFHPKWILSKNKKPPIRVANFLYDCLLRVGVEVLVNRPCGWKFIFGCTEPAMRAGSA